jgi:hypothetical protein
MHDGIEHNELAGCKLRFVMVSPSLFGFGIKKENGACFSDPEKTLLDFIYVWRYNAIPEEQLVSDVSGFRSTDLHRSRNHEDPSAIGGGEHNVCSLSKAFSGQNA